VAGALDLLGAARERTADLIADASEVIRRGDGVLGAPACIPSRAVDAKASAADRTEVDSARRADYACPHPTMNTRLRVHFIHGLEGSPHGAKPRFLAQHFDTVAPAMDTSDLPGAIATQAAALAANPPDVVVGSSFGGAITVALLDQGAWRGPTVLLAPAAARLDVPNRLPEGVAVTVVHGDRDDIIPIDDSRALARTGTAALVRLIEVADDHRLKSLLDTGSLAEIVREAYQRRG
jgi:predicted esterase